MALTNSARSKLFKLVQQSKKLLYQEIQDQLQLHYGIFPKDGKVILVEELTTSDADVIYTAKLLRDRLTYLAANLAEPSNKIKESIEQLIREQAFSILNRMAALRMAEERGIIRETVGKFFNSEGFQVYDSITGQGATTNTYTRYKWYIHAIFDELSLDLPSIFDRFSPYSLIFPSEESLTALLEIINNEEVSIHREEGSQPLNLWKQDETIGWIYQYYNGREEISVMREASSAPRNSRELAVRNQFFTPRYVVQFLTDNSLGRIWHEMTKGKTDLISVCQYLIRRPNELFLGKGQTRPEKADDTIDYIEYRPIKDPREILILDPACGSMHFGLYSFDLMEVIYREAWDHHPELLTDLRLKMTRQQFLNQVPEFIIRHNIHGVDIDPRALQIAALSLWLRAQKSFDKLGLPAVDRSSITRSNLVLAEAMPGNAAMLSELVKPLDKPMRQLMLAIWEKMQLAGETGLLLRIENEIDETIKEIAKGLTKEIKTAQLDLSAEESQTLVAEKAALYATKKYRDDFLMNAEAQVLNLLKQLAEASTNGDAYQKLLFSDDTARGFSFIDLCRKRYDVIVMNPPFGASSVNTKAYIDKNFQFSRDDLAAVFLDRMAELSAIHGKVGCISTRTIFFLGSFDKWRTIPFTDNYTPFAYADFGDGVLDATVETACYILDHASSKLMKSFFLRILLNDDKESGLRQCIYAIRNNEFIKGLYYLNFSSFQSIPGMPFAYWLKESAILKFKQFRKLEDNQANIRVGLQTGDDFRFLRNYWEVESNKISTSDFVKDNKNSYWAFYTKTDFASPFFSPITLVVNWKEFGKELQNFYDSKGKLRSALRSSEYYGKPGISYMLRSTRIFPYASPKNCIPTAGRSQIFNKGSDIYNLFAFVASNIFSSLVRLKGEQFARPKFQAGMLQEIPSPNLNLLSFSEVENEVNERYINSQITYVYKEPYLEFIVPKVFLKSAKDSLYDSSSLISSEIETQICSLYNLDNEEYESLKVDLEEALSIRKDFSNEGDSQNYEDAFALIQYLVGVFFKRYDLSLCWNDSLRPSLYKIFETLKSKPLGCIEASKEADTFNYPTGDIFDCTSGKGGIFKAFETYFKYLALNGFKDIHENLLLALNITNINQIFNNPNLLFNYHLGVYSMNKRISPIYWLLSSRGGNYNVWISYHNLNDQTLFKIVNNFIEPKLIDVEASIRKLELNTNLDNKGKKELAELQDFLHELQEMETEILRVAALPYKPNHDDGVLITAAPLYKLFRHAKWRKSTEECWKALEKGEYDWAHLAYAIWPERVTKMCKKDLSLAIAHGLEKICEIKPKEKKERVKKVPKEIKKDLKLDL
jgi:hypothetical protein